MGGFLANIEIETNLAMCKVLGGVLTNIEIVTIHLALCKVLMGRFCLFSGFSQYRNRN